ncbi:MAG: acetate--CoA ligase family protein, partial [Paracoccaceae bacterium]
ATIDAVAILSDIGAGGAVCFASGFQEAQEESNNGAELENQLLDAAKSMAILGPNCYGFINYLDGALLWPDQHGGVKTDRGVAIITQSSNIAINITMQRRGLPIAYMITVGNQAQTDLAELAATVLLDDRVSAVGLHIEGVKDIRTLEALALQARGANKPVIALKVGRSEQAQTAAISHTASLAGSDAGARALLKRLSIPWVDTLPEFIEALKLLHVTGPLPSNRIASMSCSGGEASLMADLAAKHGVNLPPLNCRQKTELRQILGPMVSLANPLDYHTYIWNNPAAMADSFTAMMDPDLALGIVIADFPRADRCDVSDWDCVIGAVAKTQRNTGQPMAIAASLPENMPENIAAQLIADGVTPLCGLPEALTAVRVAAEFGNQSTRPAPILLPQEPNDTTTITEMQAKIALAGHGLEIPQSIRITNISALPDHVGNLTFPMVLKGEGLAHKTELGAVALDLTSLDQITHAAAAMPADSWLLEEMVSDVIAELIVGVVIDAAHGYVLTIGAGGTLAEILHDTVSLIIPTTSEDIETAIKQLRIFKIIQGYRGRPAASVSAIVDAVMSVQAYVIAEHGRVAEIEINPLLCLENRAVAADALICIGDRID